MTVTKYPPCFYRLSVKALIYQQDKILLIKEADGQWELPGGGLEVGETFSQGLLREIMEELGVNLVSFHPQPRYVWTLVDDEGIPKVMMAFSATVDSQSFTGNSEESCEINFFSPSEIAHLNLHPNIRKLPELLLEK